MKAFFSKNLFHFLSALLLLVAVTIMALTAYQSGTWLTGWDNLHPEFNFWLNIQRAIDSAWKPFQGTGAVSGIALSSELPRQFFLWALGAIIPAELLRFTWTILMLFVGPWGVYWLISLRSATRSPLVSKLSALLGMSFYLLNFGTVQSFYTPYESFVTQYAFLPWLILSALLLIEKMSLKRLLFFFLAVVAIMPAAYVPTVFISSMISLALFTLSHFFFTQQRRGFLLKTGVIFLNLFIFNLHWLAPFAYYVATQGSSTASSTINTFASNDARASNTEYGRWSDIALLRGFWFEYLDTPAQSQPQFLMPEWREHFDQLPVILVGYGLFLIVLIGAASVTKQRSSLGVGALILFVFSLFMLKSYNPPLGWLFSFLSENMPFFKEIFRYTFTKWVIPAALAYSLLFSFGFRYLCSLIGSTIHTKLVGAALCIALVLMQLGLVFPLFAGHLFSSRNQLAIPAEYFSVMEYFKTQPKYARIATLPQYAFWGWDVHTWGYRGSGWWRHGLAQPVLERTHDVWAPSSEQYYTELNTALYTEDLSAFKTVMSKYQVGWLLIDNSLNFGPDKNLTETVAMAKASGLFETPLTFGQLIVYPHKDRARLGQSYMSSTALTAVNTDYAPALSDAVFTQAGEYAGTDDPNLIPLFDQASYQNLTSTENLLTFTKELNLKEQYSLSIPSYISQEKVVLAQVATKRAGSTLELTVTTTPPQVSVNDQIVAGAPEATTLSFANVPLEDELFLSVNDQLLLIPIQESAEFRSLGELYLQTQKPNQFSLLAQEEKSTQDLSPEFQSAELQTCASSKLVGAKKDYDDGSFSLTTDSSELCLSAATGTLEANTDYLFILQFRAPESALPIVALKQDSANTILLPLDVAPTGETGEWHQATYRFTTIAEAAPASIIVASNTTVSKKKAELFFKQAELKAYQKVSTPVLFSVEAQSFPLTEVNLAAGKNLLAISVPTPQTARYGQGYSAAQARFFDSYNCDPFNNQRHQTSFATNQLTFEAVDASRCQSWLFHTSDSTHNYLFEIEHQHVTGRPLEICLANSTTARCVIKTLLEPSQNTTQFFPVPGNLSKVGSYALQLNNLSIGRIATKNSLSEARLHFYPLAWVNELSLQKTNQTLLAQPLEIEEVAALSNSLIFAKVSMPETTQPYSISLSQSYDKGWQLFVIDESSWLKIPLLEQFGLGQRIESHFMQSGWKNGWIIEPDDNNGQNELYLVVVFVPAWMQFVAWPLSGLAIITMVFLIFRLRKRA